MHYERSTKAMRLVGSLLRYATEHPEATTPELQEVLASFADRPHPPDWAYDQPDSVLVVQSFALDDEPDTEPDDEPEPEPAVMVALQIPAVTRVSIENPGQMMTLAEGLARVQINSGPGSCFWTGKTLAFRVGEYDIEINLDPRDLPGDVSYEGHRTEEEEPS
jgi:hypothetical protein